MTLEETIAGSDDKEAKDTKPTDKGGDEKSDDKADDEAPKEETAEDVKQAMEQHESNGTSKPSDTAEEPHADPNVPSTVLEKGILYFFFRPRVNIDHPEEVDDIARSYIILRPMAPDAGLGSGPIGDAGNSRVLALPKKTLPQSGRERYMVFVNRVGTSFETLKSEFLEGEKRETKTQGTSVVPEAVPAAEGVYLMTNNGRESHLAYAVTRPKELGEVQNDLGLKKQGSFVLSTKNPKTPAPQNTQLPEGPEFSKEVQDEFRNLRWMPSKPEHLDTVNAQILFIGESSGIDKAVEPRKKDQKEGKEEPREVLEELEEEDLARMKGLSDSDAVFRDLETHAGEYPDMMTTF